MGIQRRRWLYPCVLLILCFIWGNSLLPATASRALSQVVKDILALVWSLGEGNGDDAHGLLRKAAHCMEYALLGAVMCQVLRGRWREKWKDFLLWGMAVCWIDETIQLFSPGRSAQIDDLWIDMTGFVLGGLLVLLAKSAIQKIQNNRNGRTKTI